MKEPVEYSRWKCAYKCRSTFTSKKKAIEHHKVCWYNPENKTCKTCFYEKIEREYVHDDMFDFVSSHDIRICENPNTKLQDYIDENEDKLKTTSGRIKPIVNCEFWKAKNRKMAIDMILID